MTMNEMIGLGIIDHPPSIEQLAIALLLSTALAARSLKRKTLTKVGAMAAFIAGLISFSLLPSTSGCYMLLFYLMGTKATKVNKEAKADLVEEEKGGRTAEQVLSCCLPAIALTLQRGASNFDSFADPTHLAILSFYSTMAADTLASELGLALKKDDTRTYLCVPPFPAVPAGVNGGVTLPGTAAAAGGAAFVGLYSFLLFKFYYGDSPSVIVCSFFSLFLGLVGCMIDSVLGAVLQNSYFKGGRVYNKDPGGDDVKRYGVLGIGDEGLLTNAQVNLASGLIITYFAFTLAVEI